MKAPLLKAEQREGFDKQRRGNVASHNGFGFTHISHPAGYNIAVPRSAECRAGSSHGCCLTATQRWERLRQRMSLIIARTITSGSCCWIQNADHPMRRILVENSKTVCTSPLLTELAAASRMISDLANSILNLSVADINVISKGFGD